jgi:DNA-directed RNA polymerase subunit beta
VHAIRYLLTLRAGKGEIDDIDHLGNRRVRTIQELAGDEFRKGFLKLRRTAHRADEPRERRDRSRRAT